ncbi:hypothetical protein LL033_02770 [Clostridium estertheticum]|uniref:hypothetical protein n=1 Tax=Clostridium estertheticum TaxID=238834 RepID=UPI001C0DE072|nr:hypothetical protein [Clostridium estertheticum]MBU3215437.1 hypothetical protein [Clostridium estertheticum]WAG56178.1 hypothetical protein LL033_02770 [Clostridium estertheticum]
MGYSVTMDNHKEHFNIQLTNTKGCTYCKEGKQLLDTTGDNSWYIDESKNEIRLDKEDISVQTIKIYYCPMCGRKLT